MDSGNQQKISEKVKQHILKDETSKAINFLKLHKLEGQEDLTVIESQFNSLNRKQRKGLIKDEYLTIELNKIKDSILDIAVKADHNSKITSKKGFTIKLFEDEKDLINFLNDRFEGKYKIEKTIHNGDRSIIFKALVVQHNRVEKAYRVIKIIKPYSVLKTDNLENLHSDIRSIRELSKHNGVITIHDGPDESYPRYPWCFIMQYIEGKTIKEHLDLNQSWRIDEILRIVLKIMRTINYIGRTHGDLRPHEIILNEEEEGNPVVSPFRIVKNSFFTKKATERIITNCKYMSPEELLSDRLSPKKKLSKNSDQFSIGLIAYEMIEGKALYDGNDVFEVMEKRILHKKDSQFVYKNIKNKDCPKEFINILEKMLQPDSKKRYKSLINPIVEIEDLLIKERKKIKIDGIKVRDSYYRCRDCKNHEFIKYFYANFFKSNEGAEAKFHDKQAQYKKLDDSIEKLVNISLLERSKIKREMTDLAKKHSEKWDIKKHEYDIFMEELIHSIKKFDIDYWTPDLEDAWSKILGEGVRLMKSYSH